MKPGTKKPPGRQPLDRDAASWLNFQFPAKTFPLELHAKIAALLLDGDDFQTASERALLLLNTCAQRGRKQSDFAATQEFFVKQFKDLGLDGTVPLKRAMAIITGQSRPDRAEADFLMFLEHRDPEWSKAQPTDLQGWTREGLHRAVVVCLRVEFQFRAIQGELGKSRKPNKKSFDKKERPKADRYGK